MFADCAVTSGVGKSGVGAMEPRRFVTNGLSRNIRATLRERFVAEAVHPDDTFTIRCQNECYACRLKSRSSCHNSCRSSVNPNTRNDDVELVEVRLSVGDGSGSR